MSIYSSVSDLYIRTTIDATLYDEIYTSCYNLSAILGDTEGKLSRTTISQLLKSLVVTAPGIITLSGTTGLIDPDARGSIVPLSAFDEQISNVAYNLYIKFFNLDESLITGTNTTITSPILSLSNQMQPAIRNALSSIYLESFALYQQLLSLVNGSKLENTSRSDLDRVSSNIRWISYQIENNYSSTPYDILTVIRDLQKTILYIKSLPFLFIDNYSNQLAELNKWIGGISDE